MRTCVRVSVSSVCVCVGDGERERDLIMVLFILAIVSPECGDVCCVILIAHKDSHSGEF